MRLAVAVGCCSSLLALRAARLAALAAWCRALREVLPFLTCILIYTNLHDTIGFVNPHDVHHCLAALDRAALRRAARACGPSASSRPRARR